MFVKLCKSRLGIALLSLPLFLGWLGIQYGKAVVDASRLSAERIRFPDTAKVVRIPAVNACTALDSLVVTVGFLPPVYRDTFFVTEIHVTKSGTQSNFFGFRSPQDVMGHDSPGAGTLEFPVKAVRAIEIDRLLREFSTYTPDEKNLTPDSSNATLMLSYCGAGYSKYLDYTYGEWNHRRTRSLMRASQDVWMVNLDDSLANNMMRRASAEIYRCSFWKEGIDENWLSSELMGVFINAILFLPLLLFVLLPIIYASVAKSPREYIGICFCVFVVLHSIVGVVVWNSDEYNLLFLLFAIVTQVIVCVICHIIWWYGYRNDSGESKK